MVINDGMSSVRSVKLILVTESIIRIPTIISAGPYAHLGIAVRIGVKNRANPKKKAVTSVVSPVRPPSSIPAADSIYVPVVVVPQQAWTCPKALPAG